MVESKPFVNQDDRPHHCDKKSMVMQHSKQQHRLESSFFFPMKSPSTVVILAAEVAAQGIPATTADFTRPPWPSYKEISSWPLMTNAEHVPSFATRAIPDRTPLYHRLFRPSSPPNSLTSGGICHT